MCLTRPSPLERLSAGLSGCQAIVVRVCRSAAPLKPDHPAGPRSRRHDGGRVTATSTERSGTLVGKPADMPDQLAPARSFAMTQSYGFLPAQIATATFRYRAQALIGLHRLLNQPGSVSRRSAATATAFTQSSALAELWYRAALVLLQLTAHSRSILPGVVHYQAMRT
jgi:hypothetical protein